MMHNQSEPRPPNGGGGDGGGDSGNQKNGPKNGRPHPRSVTHPRSAGATIPPTGGDGGDDDDSDGSDEKQMVSAGSQTWIPMRRRHPSSSSNPTTTNTTSSQTSPREVVGQDRVRLALIARLRLLRRERLEAEEMAKVQEDDMSAAAREWQSARSTLKEYSSRAAALESEALALQESQRAEVALYQERVVKLAKQQAAQIDQIQEDNLAQRAQGKIDAAAELRAGMEELAALEVELARRRQVQTDEASTLASSRKGRLEAMAEQISAERVLRIHALDKKYAAKEKALVAGHKSRVAEAGRREDLLAARVEQQHTRAIATAEEHGKKSLQASDASLTFLRQQVAESRLKLRRDEARMEDLKSCMQARADRMEQATLAEVDVNDQLDAAVAQRAELDHVNASILLLGERLEAWERSTTTLAALTSHAAEERSKLQEAFLALLDTLRGKNEHLRERLTQEALEHAKRVKEGEKRRVELERQLQREMAAEAATTEASGAASAAVHPSHHADASGTTRPQYGADYSSPRSGSSRSSRASSNFSSPRRSGDHGGGYYPSPRQQQYEQPRAHGSPSPYTSPAHSHSHSRTPRSARSERSGTDGSAGDYSGRSSRTPRSADSRHSGRHIRHEGDHDSYGDRSHTPRSLRADQQHDASSSGGEDNTHRSYTHVASGAAAAHALDASHSSSSVYSLSPTPHEHGGSQSHSPLSARSRSSRSTPRLRSPPHGSERAEDDDPSMHSHDASAADEASAYADDSFERLDQEAQLQQQF
jgi:hypothetical protein